MKKALALLLAALMALTMLVACSGKKDDADAIIGTWAHEETQDGMATKMTMQFKKDGTLIIKGYLNGEELMSEEEQYTIEDGKIIVDGEPEVYSISGKTLTLGEGEDAMEFTKE
mgnify:CR=1 FL=1